MPSLKLIVVTAVALSALAACGGSTATPAAAGASVPAGSSPAPTSATVPSSSAAGAATSPAPVGGSVDPCGLLGPADLRTVTGATYGAGVPDSVGECTWRVGNATVNDGKGQVIAAIQAVTIDYVKSSYGSGGTDVTISGHAGFWNPTQGLQSMWVDIGNGNALVLSFDPIVDESQSWAQKLAEIAVSKM